MYELIELLEQKKYLITRFNDNDDNPGFTF